LLPASALEAGVVADYIAQGIERTNRTNAQVRMRGLSRITPVTPNHNSIPTFRILFNGSSLPKYRSAIDSLMTSEPCPFTHPPYFPAPVAALVHQKS
jgi:hypothetical protein